jgi:IclR family transcriptional regulator, KDG regulon repressor
MPAAGETRLERMIDILTALGEAEAATGTGLGVVRIAELVGREKSQVSRALRTLAGRGLLERDPETLEYRLGWRLFRLAAAVADQRLTSLGRPVLRGLVASLGETAHLSVLDGRDVVTVLSESSPSVVRANDWTGHAVPAYCTSSGRALLLDHDRAALEALVAGVDSGAAGPRAPADARELHRRIEDARARGYAIVEDEFEPGLVGVAAPVRDFRGGIVAALNVSAPRFRLADRLTAAGAEVRAAAAHLSAGLGWGAAPPAGAPDHPPHRSNGGHDG